MKKNSAIWVAVAILVIGAVGAAVYFGKPAAQKGAFGGFPNINYGASVLLDSARGDTDFDGIPESRDRCPTLPPYQIVYFQPKNSIWYGGHTITLNDVGKSIDGGSNLNFAVNSMIYSVEVNGTVYIPPSKREQTGVWIKGLFASRQQRFGIVVVQRAEVNLDTGCLPN